MAESLKNNGFLEKVVRGVSPLIGEGSYVVLQGLDSCKRESLVPQLFSKLKIPIYAQEQFPNTDKKIVVNLGDYV